jgi:hypothetical protein
MMLTKAAVATAVAAALCVPAMAPAVGNVAYSVPMGLINIDNNDVQIPVQACNNNILNNVVIGVLSKNQKAKSSNKGDCKQKNKSNHKNHCASPHVSRAWGGVTPGPLHARTTRISPKRIPAAGCFAVM